MQANSHLDGDQGKPLNSAFVWFEEKMSIFWYSLACEKYGRKQREMDMMLSLRLFSWREKQEERKLFVK